MEEPNVMETTKRQRNSLGLGLIALSTLIFALVMVAAFGPNESRLLAALVGLVILGFLFIVFRPLKSYGPGIFREGDFGSGTRTLHKLARRCNSVGLELVENTQREFSIASGSSNDPALKIAVAYRFLRPRIVKAFDLEKWLDRVAACFPSRGRFKRITLQIRTSPIIQRVRVLIHDQLLIPLNVQTFELAVASIAIGLTVEEMGPAQKVVARISESLQQLNVGRQKKSRLQVALDVAKASIQDREDSITLIEKLNAICPGLGLLFGGFDAINKYVSFLGSRLLIHDRKLPPVILVVSKAVAPDRWRDFVRMAVKVRSGEVAPLSWKQFQRVQSGISEKTDRSLLEAFKRQRASSESTHLNGMGKDVQRPKLVRSVTDRK